MISQISSLGILTAFLVLVRFHPCSSSPDELYYSTCGATYDCGSVTGIGYPFRGNRSPDYCGYPGFALDCDQNNVTRIGIASLTYRVLSIDQADQVMRLARDDVTGSNCPRDIVNTTLDYDRFDYSPGYMNVSFLYGCPVRVTLPGFGVLSCGTQDEYSTAYVLPGAVGPGNCDASVVVPVAVTVSWSGPSANLSSLDLGDGFNVRWKVDGKACGDCVGSKGRCGYDYISGQTACFCPDPPYVTADACSATTNTASSGSSPATSGRGSSKKSQINIVLPVVGAILAGIAIGWLMFFVRQRRKRRVAQLFQTLNKDAATTPLSSETFGTSTPTTGSTPNIRSYPSSKSESAKSSYMGVKVFDHSELEKATGNFDASKELGDGGFGTVYYGKLADGREVAVKRLYENNFKRVEQFMNEVEILTQLHHDNLVKLYGCTSKRSRELLLVYEYISNGTVADHLHGKRSNPGSTLLSWSVRLNIAIETADALAYLHSSNIIHRDVKTNNILLDNDFRVKIADFGLSRLFPNDATHVSTVPQGTPGYVDPEYYQCYQLTDKSDVYSFGVVLTELISSLQAVDTSRCRHNINLANMAIDKIQGHALHELVDKSLGFEKDVVVRRAMMLVAELAFQCLQQEKDMRPSMKQVLETLRGIKNEDLKGQKQEVVDIVVDAGTFHKG